MTDVINPKRASPDQLLPYHKKISAEGKAQMICFISYTYMVLKRTQRVLMESAVGIYFRRGKRASFKASAAGHSAPRKLRGRRKRLCAAKCLTSDFITSKHKKRTQRVLMESAVGIYFRRGKSRSFKASADGHSAPRKLRGHRRRLCAAKCLTSSFYFYPFIKT